MYAVLRSVILVLVVALTSGLPGRAQLRPPVTAPAKKKKPAPKKPTEIVVQTSPNAEVYLDDQFAGRASPEGRLVIANPKPGAHSLRVSLPGKQEFKQNVSWIPPGAFMMGCSPGSNECYGDEKPPHQVTITKGFWLGQTEVTVGAYKRFSAATGHQMPPAPSFNKGWANDNMPVVRVTWDDAQAYCGWMGGRLPTEAEWEYAARGGSTEARYDDIDAIAWYDKNSGGRAHEVAQKRGNRFGLFDMLGNVWEWVNDRHDKNYYRSSPSQDPAGPSSGHSRVLRGGSWSSDPRVVRVSVRYGDRPDLRDLYVGFRCAGGVGKP